MNFDDLLASLDANKYQSLKRAVELGKWPDGRLLQNSERDLALQVLIAYDAKHKPEDQRIGYLNKNKSDARGSDNASSDIIHRQ